jgi:hypothetical protein
MSGWSCENEEKITPEGVGPWLTPIAFPQGSDAWDKIFEDIYKEHGVKIIYKDFSDKDWSHTWINQAGAEITGERFETPEELTDVANYMKKYLFDVLDPATTRGVFRRYIFLVKDMKVANLSYSLSIGTDNWAFSPPVGQTNTNSYPDYVYKPKIRVFSEILITAFKNGNITLPETFYEGIDYDKTTIGYSSARTNNRWEDLWCRRGFLTTLTGDGWPTFPDAYPTMMVTITGFPGQPEDEFSRFVRHVLAIRGIDRYFANGGRFELSPKLSNRINIVINHLESAHGIDLLAYQAVAYDGYTGNEWDDSLYAPAIP